MHHHIPINFDKYQQLTARSSILVGTELQPAARRPIPENPSIQQNSSCITSIPTNTSAVTSHIRNTSPPIPKIHTQADKNQDTNMLLSVENSKKIQIPAKYPY
jgi:hypothetical protein